MKECDLSAPAQAWLVENGFTPYAEVPCLGRCVDLIGYSPGGVRCVELKLGLTKKLVYQALTCQLITWDTWCLIASKPRQASIDIAIKHGLGMALFDGQRVIEIARPAKAVDSNVYHLGRILEKIRMRQPGGIAGNPTLAGIGPAQDCVKRVDEYRSSHPKATWQEIFDNVENHYAHARSMQQGIAFAREAPQRNERMRNWRKRQCEEKAVYRKNLAALVSSPSPKGTD